MRPIMNISDFQESRNLMGERGHSDVFDQV